MANPRQRRAQRSGIAKASQSKKSKKHQKKVIFKGPPVLAEAWDKHKTVRQNYAALGLLNTPNPRMSGGLEPLPVTPFVRQQQAQAAAAEASTSAGTNASTTEGETATTASTSSKIPKGYARLIRDEEGNVIDVEFGEDGDAEQTEGDAATPWGEPLDRKEQDERPVYLPADYGVRRTQGIPMPDPAGDGIHVPHKPRPAPTPIVQELERMASRQRAPEKRSASDREKDWLVGLVQKYDDDVDRMARDIERNPMQKTPAQIRKSIKLAGGLDALRST